MRFVSLSTLTLLPTLTLSLPSSLSPSARQILPTAQTIKQDILNIHNAVLSLDTTIQSYTGSPFPVSVVNGIPVLLGVAQIHTVNRAGFRHALAALPFSADETKEVIETVVSTVNISIPASTEHIKTKQPAFQQGALSAIVIASLELLKYDHDTFSAAVLAKGNEEVGQEEMQRGEEAVANIHDAIQSAISYYAERL